MKIYLSTCDKTSYILSATIYLYKMFYNPCPPIIVLGFSKPILYDWNGVEFVSLGAEQVSINYWSKYIYDYFITITDDFVFFALDDFFPIDYINKVGLQISIDYMKNNKVGFCVVSQEPSSYHLRNEVEEIIYDTESFFLYRRKKNVNYQLVLQPGIWNRNYLCKMFQTPLTPWEFELDQSIIANNETEYFNISSSNFPCDNHQCIMPYSLQSSLSSKWSGISVIGLRSQYVDELIELGLLNKELLLIGAWESYIKYTNDISYDDFVLLCKKWNMKEWIDLYSKYYISENNNYAINI